MAPVPRTILPAPVSEMAVVRSGVRAHFSGQGDGFRVKIRFRIAQVVVTSGGHVAFSVYGDADVSIVASQDIQFYPPNNFYFPPYVTQIVQLFELWELFSAVLEYEPRTITTSTAAFVIGGCEDPMWPESHGQISSGLTNPTEDALSSLASSCTVVSYGRCRISLPVNKGRAKGNKLYVAGYGSSLLDYNTTEASVIRDCTGAVAMIQGTGGNQSASTILGDLYCEMDMGLYNFTTAVDSGVTLRRSEKKSAAIHPAFRKFGVQTPLTESEVSTVGSPYVAPLSIPKSMSRK